MKGENQQNTGLTPTGSWRIVAATSPLEAPMRRTLMALLFTLGLSACGGVVEEAETSTVDQFATPCILECRKHCGMDVVCREECTAQCEAGEIPLADDGDTHSALEWCQIGDPSCEEVQGTSCWSAGATKPCCHPWGRETCICIKSAGYWSCPM